MFDVNTLYTFHLKLHPEDNHKWGNKELDLSGLVIAEAGDMKSALEKVYEHCGVPFGKTVCQPNVRHFVTEQLPYFSKGTNSLTTGFTVI